MADSYGGTEKYDSSGNQYGTLGTALNKSIDSIASYPGGTTYTQLSASGAVGATGSGQLHGVFVSAASSAPTIKIWDNSAGSGSVLIDTFTPVAATYYSFGSAKYSTGCYATIGGTVSATFFTGPTVNSL